MELFSYGAGMTDIKRFMDAQGVTNGDMVRLTGVTGRTIINWSMGHKKTPLAVTVLMDGVQSGAIKLDWWKDQAKRSKGEQ